MNNIKNFIEAGEINDALMNNGVFVASNLIENNMQVVNDIYLNTLAQGVRFDDIQRDALLAIAMLTPYLGGDAVYSARLMLGIDPRDYNLFHRYAKPESTTLPVITTLKVYPNPVTDELTIEILDGMKDGLVTVELFDLPGKKVFSLKIPISSSKGSVNLSGVKNGIYLLKVSDAFGNRKTTRIVVNK
jgi:hypothetical protein